MRPRIPEATEDRIEALLDDSQHDNKSQFAVFAVKRYVDELEARGAE